MKDMKKYINPAVANVPPSGIRKFFDLVAGAKDVISLGVGEPDFVTPWSIREEAIYSINSGYTMYTSNYGTPELRREIVKYLYERFGLSYDENKNIIITVGASEAIDLAIRALTVPGDEILIPQPSYVSYQACAAFAGAIPVPIPLSAENNFRLTAEELESYITPKTKMVVLSFPNNPTGAIMTKEELNALADVITKHDLLVVSDEIYAELTYEGEPASFSAIPGMQDRTVLVSGMSKAFAMTGWRIGYTAANSDFIAAMVKIHQYTILCAPISGQMAAVEAFQNGKDEVVRMREQYNLRRNFIVSRMREIGFDLVEPKGAFYAFPSIKKFGINEEVFAEKLLEKQKVAIVPGTAFGDCGSDFVRISYATSYKQLEAAMNRIEKFVNNL